MRSVCRAVAVVGAIASCAAQTDPSPTPAASSSVTAYEIDLRTALGHATDTDVTSAWEISVSVASAVDLGKLAFAISTKYPTGQAPSGTENGMIVDLAEAYTAYATGAWTVSGKTFSNNHIVHKGSPHKQKIKSGEKSVPVEICKPVWAAGATGFQIGKGPLTNGSLTRTLADVECGCGECGDSCGLKNSRLDVPCSADTFTSQGVIMNGTGSAAADYKDLCTAYAYNGEIDSSAREADYCCDVKPSAFADVVGALTGVFFATGTTGVVNEHTAGQPWTKYNHVDRHPVPWTTSAGDLAVTDPTYPINPEDSFAACDETGLENTTFAPTYTHTGETQ